MQDDSQKYLEEILLLNLNVSPLSTEVLGMSIGGGVTKIKTEKGTFVLKLIANEPLTAVKDEDVGERVYGARWTEFEATYTAMRESELPLPKVHATGFTKDNSHYYILMDYIPGESVREYMVTKPNDESLHHAIGSVFGKMHTLTRSYQGWVSMEVPYEESWGSAFFTALGNQITEIESLGYLNSDEVAKMRMFVNSYKLEWAEAKKFVLSHLDGFQGIAAEQGGEWSVTGIIDIEDHQYTDQRFVLCGHELAMETEGQKLPKSFWDGYQKEKDIDETHEKFKPLFKLYYLSVWLCVFKDRDIGVIPDRENKAQKMKDMIISLVS